MGERRHGGAEEGRARVGRVRREVGSQPPSRHCFPSHIFTFPSRCVGAGKRQRWKPEALYPKTEALSWLDMSSDSCVWVLWKATRKNSLTREPYSRRSEMITALARLKIQPASLEGSSLRQSLTALQKRFSALRTCSDLHRHDIVGWETRGDLIRYYRDI